MDCRNQKNVQTGRMCFVISVVTKQLIVILAHLCMDVVGAQKVQIVWRLLNKNHAEVELKSLFTRVQRLTSAKITNLATNAQEIPTVDGVKEPKSVLLEHLFNWTLLKDVLLVGL